MVLHCTKLENHIFPYKLGKNSEFSHMNWVSKWMNSIHSLARCEVMLGTSLNPNPPWTLNQWHGILRLHGQLGEPISLWMVVWFTHGDSPKKNHHICVGEITMMLSFNLYTGWILLNMVLKKMCVSHKIPSKKIHHIQGVGISDSCTQTKHATSQNSSSSWWIALHFAERATIASIRLIWPYQQDTITMACCKHVPFQPNIQSQAI